MIEQSVDDRKMSKKIEWVDIHERLPERFVRVLTLLFRNDGGYDTIMNSIQGRHIREADGSFLTSYQWSEESLRVEYWLDGLPEPPKE